MTERNERDQKICKLMAAGGHTLRSLSSKFGVSHQLISTILKKHAIPCMGRENRRKKLDQKLEDTKSQIIAQFENGASIRQLSLQFGFATKDISRLLIASKHRDKGEYRRQVGPMYDRAIKLFRSGRTDDDVSTNLRISRMHAYIIRRRYCPETFRNSSNFLEGESIKDQILNISYHRRPTKKLRPVGMNYLSDLVVRPGMEKRMHPLCLYRGAMYPMRALRYWNFCLLMFAAEAETLADGIKLQNNAAFAQLCGPSKPLQKMTLNSFFGRLWDNPEVTRNISGFSDYVRSLELGPSNLIQVDIESEGRFVPPWRVSTHPEFDRNEIRPEVGAKALFYPFLAHDPKTSDGHGLVLLANRLVPDTLPHDIRADVCQELILGILSGEVKKENAHDFVKKYIGKVFRSVAFKFECGGFKSSFDAPLPGTEDLTLHEVISDGSYTHWSDQMEETDGKH